MFDRYTMNLEMHDETHVRRMERGSQMLHRAIEAMLAGEAPNTPSTVMWCQKGNQAGIGGYGKAA